MQEFSTEKFFVNITNVDRDLRIMALFDLGRYCKGSNGQVGTDMIVEAVMHCLTREERCLEVRSEAASTVPSLTAKCLPSQQLSIFRFLLSMVTSSTQKGDASELADLCCLALRRSVEEVVSASKLSIKFWQSELKVANELATLLRGALTLSTEAQQKEIIYPLLNTIIPPFACTWDLALVQDLVHLSFEDVQVPLCRGVATSCCSSLLLFTDDTCFNRVCDSSLSYLKVKGPLFVTYSLLYESILREDPLRIRVGVPAVAAILVKAMGSVEDIFETKDDASEVILSFYNRLVRSFADETRQSFAAATLCCVTLSRFNPSHCGGGVTNYDGYDDYYGAAVDSSWRIRLWAMRILQGMVTTGNGRESGSFALQAVTCGLRDEVQDVQQEAFVLLRTVSQQPYCTSALLRETCQPLLESLQCSGEREVAEALTVVEDMFKHVADAVALYPLVGVGVVQVLERATPSASYIAEAISAGRAVLDVLLKPGTPAQTQDALCLGRALLRVSGDGFPKRIFLSAVGCNASFIQLASLRRGNAIATEAVGVLARVPGCSAYDAECRNAAVAAIGLWLSHLLVPTALVQDVLEALCTSLTDSQVCASALRSLNHPTLSTYLSNHTTNLMSLVATSGCDSDTQVRQSAFQVTATLVESGCILAADLLCQWVSSSKNALASNHFNVTAASLRLLSVLCISHDDAVADVVVAACQCWSYLGDSSVSRASTCYGDAVTALAALTHTLCSRYPSNLLSLEQSVIFFLCSDSSVSTQHRCTAVGALLTDDTSSGDFLSRLPFMNMPEHYRLLAMGKVGSAFRLPETMVGQLLDSVQNGTSETVRACGELAIAHAITYSGNGAILDACTQRVNSADTKGRYYYLNAMRTSVILAKTMEVSVLKDRSVCVRLIAILVDMQGAPELIELVGDVIGGLASFCLLETVEYLRRSLATPERRVVCAAATIHIVQTVLTRCVDALKTTESLVRDLMVYLTGTSSKSLPLKTMILRLTLEVSKTQPAWLVGDADTFSRLLKEMHKYPKLVESVDIGGYRHYMDRGLECRSLAFKCVAGIVEADETKGTQIVASSMQFPALLDIVINACSSANQGETACTINILAKVILLKLLRGSASQVTPMQLNTICAKLRLASEFIVKPGADADNDLTSTLSSIYTIVQLGKLPVCAHDPSFRRLLFEARVSPLLTDAVHLSASSAILYPLY